MKEEERLEFLAGLKKSKDIIGHIYPVVVKKGTLEIVDGKHRKQVDPAWPEKEVEFSSKKEEILFRMHANYRRKISRKERAAEMLLLASILEEEGVPREQMVSKLAEITPFSERYIRSLLPIKYKVSEFAHKRTKVYEEPVPRMKTEAKATEIVTPERAKPTVEVPVEEVPETPIEAVEAPAAPTPPPTLAAPIEEVGRPAAVPVSKPSGKTRPRPAIPRTFTCPRCHVEVKTLYCSKCFSELSIRDVAKILKRMEA